MEKNARGWGGYEGSRHDRIDVNGTAIARELNLKRMVKKRPLDHVTQRPIGGGEGTDVPCFSAWAGLCLHPRGMRGVLASYDAPSARSSYLRPAGL